ncbi:MAG: hypothetical protein AAF497_18450 [Planctomycetota bacterium]
MIPKALREFQNVEAASRQDGLQCRMGEIVALFVVNGPGLALTKCCFRIEDFHVGRALVDNALSMQSFQELCQSWNIFKDRNATNEIARSLRLGFTVGVTAKLYIGIHGDVICLRWINSDSAIVARQAYSLEEFSQPTSNVDNGLLAEMVTVNESLTRPLHVT